MLNLNIEQYLEELELLVNMDSGQGNPEGITAVGKFFMDRFDKMGWITEQVDVGPETGKVTIVRNREADHYDALLVGHVDTVFETGETARRPFRRDESRAYGLGVIDMKQGCLTMLHILEQLPAEINEKLNIVAIFNPDEEIVSPYSKDVIDEYARKADYAYIFEAASTDGSRCMQRKGRYKADVTFHGQAGHAGYLLEGNTRSAINELVHWAGTLTALCSVEKQTSVNVGTISGGVKYNIVPDYAHMTFESRYEHMSEYENLIATIELLKAHAEEMGIGVEITDVAEIPPMVPEERSLAYEQRIKALSEANGIPYKSKKRGGLSDANHICACGPICLDGLGPTGDCDHSEKEYLELSTIEPNTRFAYLLLLDLADMKSEK
jgi:glutamate carboxypeptidase